jgi:hypothetical protein
LNQEDINHQNRPITSNETEAGIKSLTKKKGSVPDKFIAEFYQNLKEELAATLIILLHEIERKNTTKFIPCSQYYTHPQSGQGHYKKKRITGQCLS